MHMYVLCQLTPHSVSSLRTRQVCMCVMCMHVLPITDLCKLYAHMLMCAYSSLPFFIQGDVVLLLIVHTLNNLDVRNVLAAA